ncbi:L-rhamnose/proton symporter RhaT [Flavitalea sp. BT771]|uniref:L-rhamnose/proton symporter RhaT n=1 Tax=Flavitalea sp. BT771 TaxID=3063329 RepID=UPI0026E2E200|nr:L-rhamnose/proton symporter RhaT [Flavitalea sp. BT771]MDO6430624.1 L-rhamnose/proton symporter RhaT [Flavitalea sp. BT771]MDV6219236.1 L-rhamnose/proton symporter RhaT [Flavitalea sp. BT771]
MQVLFGIIFHFIGGFASGSFYIPYKKVKGWSWESYWIVGGLFSWLIIPPLAAWLTVPHFTEIISATSAATLGWTFFWGILWGIGGLMYGLGMRYLGMSLGNSVLLGFTSAFGALVPSIYYNFAKTPGKTTFTELLTTSWGRIVLAGVVLCLLGIYICGRAGVLKEKELPEEKKKESIKEFNLVKGLVVCTISGILSACFNYGIEAGGPMSEMANSFWQAAHPEATTKFLYQNNVTYIVLLWGGLTTNFIWCMILNAKNKTFGDYTNKKAPLRNNYFFAALAGTIWFLQFFFYGMGESRLGNGASSWILHMAFIILVANMWGIALKEWNGVSKKTRTTITWGIITILLSVFLVGYGNSLNK